MSEQDSCLTTVLEITKTPLRIDVSNHTFWMKRKAIGPSGPAWNELLAKSLWSSEKPLYMKVVILKEASKVYIFSLTTSLSN